MLGNNGYSNHSPLNLIFAFVDGLLIVLAVFMAGILRFWGESDIIPDKDLASKIMVIVLATQMSFYYFDLYELRDFGKRKRMIILLLGAISAAGLFLAVIYYLVPSLAMGRGTLAVGFLNVFIVAFFWRSNFFRLAKIRVFKERILIVGTGDLAGKIIKEISENGQDSFEVVGFIGERRKEIG